MKLHTDIHELNFFFSGLRPFSRWNTRSSKRIQRNEMLTSRCIFSRRPSLSLLIVEVVRQSIRRRRRWSNDFPVDVDRNLVPFFFVNFFCLHLFGWFRSSGRHYRPTPTTTTTTTTTTRYANRMGLKSLTVNYETFPTPRPPGRLVPLIEPLIGRASPLAEADPSASSPSEIGVAKYGRRQNKKGNDQIFLFFFFFFLRAHWINLV